MEAKERIDAFLGKRHRGWAIISMADGQYRALVWLVEAAHADGAEQMRDRCAGLLETHFPRFHKLEGLAEEIRSLPLREK